MEAAAVTAIQPQMNISKMEKRLQPPTAEEIAYHRKHLYDDTNQDDHQRNIEQELTASKETRRKGCGCFSGDCTGWGSMCFGSSICFGCCCW
ncbi:hypothetical protein BCR33DRAFT_721818 [Rhizoclosmatium globosum]|uniref:Uncharacterized protein n=1 Tax=Rhizoclosmatium globosum TaxID=329046 RepID=A0A1Y2BQ75_9FUNG|nr:hypothetical protein BCR33DRAFT_721818 [Rhizoclosmatium globosum]|eukprot:ORY36902.1 hypothetical protein BCR33DRAFT_721818 [Rhizoclosmatium globosum]